MLTIRVKIFWSNETTNGTFIVEDDSFSGIMNQADVELKKTEASLDNWAYA